MMNKAAANPLDRFSSCSLQDCEICESKTFAGFRTFGTAIVFALVVLTLSVGCKKYKPPKMSTSKNVRKGAIVGSSMAPCLAGKHYQCKCSDCGNTFRCDIEQADEREFLVCPNCGFGKIDRHNPAYCKPMPEQAVEITLEGPPPQRWQMVVFSMLRMADPVSKTGIKRVVGMPGEVITFHDGNVFANGTLLQKPIDIQKKVRVPVYDSNFYSDRFKRWVGFEGAKWNCDSKRIGPVGSTKGELVWATYQQHRCYATKKDADKVVSIEDNYGFNQSLTRDLHSVDEIFLEADVEYSASSIVGLRYRRQSVDYEFQIDIAKKSLTFTTVGARRNDGKREESTWRDSMTNSLVRHAIDGSGKLKLELTSFDSQLVLFINQKQVFTLQIEPETVDDDATEAVDNSTGDPMQIQIGVNDPAASFRRIRIWRDLYYYPAPETAQKNSELDAMDGFIVLGDNVPISVDSRHWNMPSVAAPFVIGTVDLPQKQ